MSGLLTTREIDAIVARIVSVTDPDLVLMFGSYAKGRATCRSDLDLLIAMPATTTALPRRSDVMPYLGSSIIPVDLHIVTTEELDVYGRERHHFLQSVLDTGRVLYRRAPAGDTVAAG
ncbi:MAG TPA: nucleotidyltransferase domain-containing protein [Nonomuraea sp.]|nr:nucleotidyltransferase domain-containing protein [Nonomuraea sp.]